MMKALCVVSLCALVAVASADMDLFLTKQGSTNATTYVGTQTAVGSRFNQNVTKISLAAGATTNPGTLSHGPFNLGVATPSSPVTATFYVWAHFTNIPTYEQYDPDTGADLGYALPGALQIWGLGMGGGYENSPGCYPSGPARIERSATYRQFNNPYGRWGNTDPLPFPFNSGTMGTTPAAGLVAPNPLDPLVRDFTGSGTDWYALIGAFDFTATGLSQFFFGVGNPLPFIAVRLFNDQGAPVSDWDTRDPAHFYPGLTVMGQPYTFAAQTQPIVAITAGIPEPASLSLLALASLLIRRPKLAAMRTRAVAVSVRDAGGRVNMNTVPQDASESRERVRSLAISNKEKGIMMKALCVVSLCVFAALASADIDLFLTKQGSTNATTYVGTQTAVGNRFNQNITKISLATGATTNPGTLSHGPFNLGAASPGSPVSATFYVWAHFTNIPTYEQYDPDTGADLGYALPGALQIYGLGMADFESYQGVNPGCHASGAATVSSSAMYREVNGPYGRWGNTEPLPFPYNPCTAGQTTAAGLVAPNALDPLIKDVAGNGTDWYALIGAFNYTATGASQYFFGPSNPMQFIAVRLFDDEGAIVSDWSTIDAPHYYPNLKVMGQPYTYAAHTQPLLAITTTTPEPASLILLGLASLLIRRR